MSRISSRKTSLIVRRVYEPCPEAETRALLALLSSRMKEDTTAVKGSENNDG